MLLRRFLLPALSCLVTGSIANAQAKDLFDESVLRTFELTFPSQNFWSQLLALRNESYLQGDLKVDGIVYHGVGVRFRGYASLSIPRSNGSHKLPFRISMDEFAPGQRLFGHKTIKLNNQFWDPSFLRDVLACHMLRPYMAAPRANFVKLVINAQNWGVYSNVETIDKRFAKAWFGDDEGNRYRSLNGNLTYLGNDVSRYTFSYPLKSPPNATTYQDLIAFLRVYNTTSMQERERELPKLLDIDNLFRHAVGEMIVGHHDSRMQKDFFLYHDTQHGRFHTVPWDWNIAMRSLVDMRGLPWLRDTIAMPSFAGRFDAQLRNAVKIVDWNVIGPVATRLHNLIDKEVQADPIKFYSYQDFKLNLTSRTGSGVLGIQEWINWARGFLTSLPGVKDTPPTLTAPGHSPASPGPKDRIWLRITVTGVTPRSVTLNWREHGPYSKTPMFDDGKHADGGPGDGVFGVDLPPQRAGAHIDYFFEAMGPKALGLLPATGTMRPFGFRVAPALDSVLLHEFVAANSGGIRDEKGERDDWIELFNPTSATVQLGGMHLTDDITQPTKWPIPQGTQLAPGGMLLVWADGEPGDGPFHADFKLSADGEEIALFASDGTLLDRIVFGPQAKDVSTGRLYDRVSPWVTYPEPTPGALNAPRACGTRIYKDLDSTSQPILLRLEGLPKVGTTPTLKLSGGPKNGAFLLLLAATPGRTPVPGLFTLMFGSPILAIAPAASNATGSGQLPLAIPKLPALAGKHVAFQALGFGTTGLTASNGLECVVCGANG